MIPEAQIRDSYKVISKQRKNIEEDYFWRLLKSKEIGKRKIKKKKLIWIYVTVGSCTTRASLKRCGKFFRNG